MKAVQIEVKFTMQDMSKSTVIFQPEKGMSPVDMLRKVADNLQSEQPRKKHLFIPNYFRGNGETCFICNKPESDLAYHV